MSEAVLRSEAYKNFINSIDSEHTRHAYRLCFSYFMRFCKIETYEKMLEIDPKKLEGLIRDYIIHLKADKKLSSNTTNVYVAAISHFYQMNDIILNWKKLTKFKGKKRTKVEDKPYTRKQIQKLLEFSDLRMKCIILIMCSAGLRRGAIPNLRIDDLKKIEKYNLYKITVYKKEQETYPTFCTPECAKYLDEYFEWRSRFGEVLTPKSPVIRKEFSNLDIARARPLSIHSVSWLVNHVLDKSGVRPRAESNYKSDIMQCHGFRKFFMTTAMNAGMNPVYCEYLMGHKTGLAKSYFKPTDTELLEGNDKAIGYVGVVNDLTINEENRLRKKVHELSLKKDEIKAIREEMEDRFQQILTKIDVTKVK